MPRILPFILIAGIASPAAAQTDDNEWLQRCRENAGRGDRVTHCEVRVERMPAGAALTVEPGGNGGVAIHGWDRNEVEVHARIQARSATAAAAEGLARQVTVSLQSGAVRASGPATDSGDNWSVTLVVFAPRATNFTAATQNGPMSAEGVQGRIDLSTVNGPLSLRDLRGEVLARTQNGPLTVELTGSRWEGTRLDAETKNGPVTLIVPENYSAQLETGTMHGPVSIDFPLNVRVEGRTAGREIRTTLGSGGALVRVRTTNGPLTLRRPRI
jgi:DUF4097 and DUF4098 domain-containing protein YvlB